VPEQVCELVSLLRQRRRVMGWRHAAAKALQAGGRRNPLAINELRRLSSLVKFCVGSWGVK
jgi:hypothetical protein